MADSYPCPCCGFLTLGGPPPGTFEICPVCWWEDDAAQFFDPQFAGGANPLSLEEAKLNYLAFGAGMKEDVSKVRRPLPEEIPYPN